MFTGTDKEIHYCLEKRMLNYLGFAFIKENDLFKLVSLNSGISKLAEIFQDPKLEQDFTYICICCTGLQTVNCIEFKNAVYHVNKVVSNVLNSKYLYDILLDCLRNDSTTYPKYRVENECFLYRIDKENNIIIIPSIKVSQDELDRMGRVYLQDIKKNNGCEHTSNF